jgi:hypothetical protein
MDAKAKGLELWKVEDNFTYGFGLLADYIKQFKSDWFAVGKRYNGKESYGTTFKRVVSEWKERLEGATDDEETNVPALWYPGATKREIKPGSNDPAIKPIGVILHVDAGNTRDLYNYFNGPSGGIESHFQIAKDGTVFQYRDLGHEADANYKGNSFTVNGVRRGYVSVETQGLEKGEWTDAQITAIKALLFWLHEEYDIPLRKAPSPTSAGIGYHTMFGAPGAWTPVAKSCPGPDRIRQFNNVLLPWMAQVNGSQPPVPPVVITPKPTIVKLSSGVKPNARHAQVILLKQLLMEGGYAKKGSLALDSLYGSGTRKAVAAFYKANKSLSTSSYDTAIGPKGFEELQREVYAKR